MKFIHPMTVRMYDTDAAGILYFGNQFRFAHDAFETLMHQEGLTFQDMFERQPFMFVIVHAESDYFKSLHVGDEIQVHTWIDHIGTTSFKVAYEIFSSEQRMGTASTVHVCIDKDTRGKQEFPTHVREMLEKYRA